MQQRGLVVGNYYITKEGSIVRLDIIDDENFVLYCAELESCGNICGVTNLDPVDLVRVATPQELSQHKKMAKKNSLSRIDKF